MEGDNVRVWSAKQKTELNVRLGYIDALLNVDSGLKHEVWIPNLRGRLVMTGMDCLRQCGPKDFGAVALGRNPGLVMIVHEGEGSSLWEWTGSDKFIYYQALVRRHWRAHCVWKR